MPKIKVELESPGMAALLNSAEVRAGLTKRMERVLTTAKANAPVDTGEYRDGLRLEQDSTDRVAVRVVADAPHSWIVEARTGNLSKALDAAGGS